MDLEQVQELIIWTCDDIKSMLLSKNSDYGNSALEPRRIHSKADPVEQLKVRADDKLSRMLNEEEKTYAENDLKDYIGYLILLLIAQRKERKNENASRSSAAKQLLSAGDGGVRESD